MNAGEKEIISRLEDIYDFYRDKPGYNPSGRYKSTKGIFGHRVFKFNDDAAELAYLKQFGLLADGSGIVDNIVRHQTKNLKGVAVRNMFGGDVEFVLGNVKGVAAQTKVGKAGDIVDFTNYVDDTLGQIIKHTDRISEADKAWNSAIRGVNNLVSATLTGKSFLRDVAGDKTWVTAVNRAFLTGESILNSYAQSVAQLAKVMGGRKEN